MRANLVFSSAGDNSKHKQWLACTEARRFDLWLYYFGDGRGHGADADHHVRRKGSKFQNFFHAYRDRQLQMKSFRYVLILDDDIEISGADLNRFFDLMQRYDLWEAQPAYTPDSHISLGITVHNPRFVLRYTNFCEASVFAFHRDWLDPLARLCGESLSGWGVDWIIPKLMGYPRDKVAVVDDVVCRHPFRKSELDNLLPRPQHKVQGRALVDRYGAGMCPRVFGGIPKQGARGYSAGELARINFNHLLGHLVENGSPVWKHLAAAAGYVKRRILRSDGRG